MSSRFGVSGCARLHDLFRCQFDSVLREIPALGSPLHLALLASNRRGDALTLGLDERTIAVNALPMALEIVQTREAALASRVRTLVRLGAQPSVRLNVRLHGTSTGLDSGEETRAHLEIEGSGEAAAADVAVMALLGATKQLARKVSTTAAVEDSVWHAVNRPVVGYLSFVFKPFLKLFLSLGPQEWRGLYQLSQRQKPC
jgi:hypothetical protein